MENCIQSLYIYSGGINSIITTCACADTWIPLHCIFLSVSHKNFWMCADALDEGKNKKLKDIINDYFEDQKILDQFKQKEADISEAQVFFVNLLMSVNLNLTRIATLVL